jgi:NAD(P)-dependent dehydrogenase (short-subunit alcohol dehydrogenase family)
MPAVVVIGARNLGGAILDRFIADGWDAAAIARSEETLEKVRARGAIAIAADAKDAGQLAAALESAREQLGGLDVIVNAASSARPTPGEPFGGGRIDEATLERWRRWGGGVAEMAVVFLSEGARALKASGGGALVQVTNALARRPAPAEGLWASGQTALRTLVQAAADELREEGIRASLVIVDAHIDSPKTARFVEESGVDRGTLADQSAIADAVLFAATRDPRGLTYELIVSAAGNPWIP